MAFREVAVTEIREALRAWLAGSGLRMLAQEARVPAIRAITDAGRRYHRDWVARAYGPALANLPPATRRRKLAQLTAVTDLATWLLLHNDLGLSQDQTAAAIGELVDGCLLPRR
jgi:hypothetical protein